MRQLPAVVKATPLCGRLLGPETQAAKALSPPEAWPLSSHRVVYPVGQVLPGRDGQRSSVQQHILSRAGASAYSTIRGDVCERIEARATRRPSTLPGNRSMARGRPRLLALFLAADGCFWPNARTHRCPTLHMLRTKKARLDKSKRWKRGSVPEKKGKKELKAVKKTRNRVRIGCGVGPSSFGIMDADVGSQQRRSH